MTLATATATVTARPSVWRDPFHGSPELRAIHATWAGCIRVTYGVTAAEKARYAEAVRIYGEPESMTREFPGDMPPETVAALVAEFGERDRWPTWARDNADCEILVNADKFDRVRADDFATYAPVTSERRAT